MQGIINLEGRMIVQDAACNYSTPEDLPFADCYSLWGIAGQKNQILNL